MKPTQTKKATPAYLKLADIFAKKAPHKLSEQQAILLAERIAQSQRLRAICED